MASIYEKKEEYILSRKKFEELKANGKLKIGSTYRIYDDTTVKDLVDGTVAVYKAVRDGNGNVIVETYTTKAESENLKTEILNELDSTKTELTSKIDTKVSQIEYSKTKTIESGSDGGTIGRAYIRDRQNKDNSVPIDIQAINYAIPIRDESDNFYVGNATQPQHVINKQTLEAIVGEGAPTTETAAKYLGQVYIDSTNNKTYQCTNIDGSTYTWVQLIRNTDYATTTEAGTVKVSTSLGTFMYSNGVIGLAQASQDNINAKENQCKPITPNNLDYAVKTSLTTNTIALTDDEKTAAQTYIGAMEKPNLPSRNSVVTMSAAGEINTTQLVHESATPWTVPCRDDSGNIKVAAPTVDLDAANKAYVDNAVSSVSADYITATAEGDAFETKAALLAGPYYNQGVETALSRNDYALVKADETHENAAVRYVYDGTQWDFQYEVNDTPFTDEQLAAINSGVTAEKLDSYIVKNTSTTTNAQLYIKDPDGSNRMIDVAPVGGSWVQQGIPRYSGGGCIAVGTPTWDTAAANKAYVDTKTKVLTGSTNPDSTTTANFVGQLYINTEDNTTFQCINITEQDAGIYEYTWTKLIRGTDGATKDIPGIITVNAAYGTSVEPTDSFKLKIVQASTADIEAKTNTHKPLTANNMDYAFKVSFTTNTETWSEEEQQSARDLINVDAAIKTDDITITKDDTGVLHTIGITDGTNTYDFAEIYEAMTIIRGTE